MLHIVAGAGVGGFERQLLLLLPLLSHSLENHVLLIRGGPLEKRFHQLAPTAKILKKHKVDAVFFVKLARTLRSLRPDVVHTWGSTANLWGALAAKVTGTPHLVLSEGALDEWKGIVLRGADRMIYRWADRIVTNASAVATTSVQRGAPPARTVVIANAVQLSTVSKPVVRESGLILVLGRLDARKGQDVLVEAMPQVLRAVPHAQALIVGPAQRAEEFAFEASIRRRIEQLGLGGHVRLVGAADQPEEFLARAHVVALPSRSEGSPNVVLEAMAAGAPLVAASVGGVPELVVDQVTALLVPADSPTALADALVAAMMDPGATARRTAAASELVTRRFSQRAARDAWLDLYDEVLATPKPCPRTWAASA